jgi:hypothetical protein
MARLLPSVSQGFYVAQQPIIHPTDRLPALLHRSLCIQILVCSLSAALLD